MSKMSLHIEVVSYVNWDSQSSVTWGFTNRERAIVPG